MATRKKASSYPKPKHEFPPGTPCFLIIALGIDH